MPDILIYGPVPSLDARLIQLYADESHFNVVIQQQPQFVSSVYLPTGCISYLPCDRKTITELFAKHPIGLGYKIPFFQCVQPGPLPEFLDQFPVYALFSSPISEVDARNIVMAIARQKNANDQAEQLIADVRKFRKQKQQLISIGTALSSEDSLDTLLSLILTKTREVVDADAGTIYIRDRNGPRGAFKDTLVFKVTQNDSVQLDPLVEFPVAINQNTIAGYVAFTGRHLNIEDVSALDGSLPYHYGKDYEKKIGYHSKSMMAVPLKNLDNEVVGVLQLINKRPDTAVKLTSEEIVDTTVVPFTLSDEDLILSIGSFAAVSIERALLYQSIRDIFEGFLNSSIAAIDERDSVTSGHSTRVMEYARAFIENPAAAGNAALHELSTSADRKRQFLFSALLHDIGKIGVPEYLLTKESRLSKGDFAALMGRMDLVALMVCNGSTETSWKTVEELKADREFLKRINTAGRLSDEDFKQLSIIGKKEYRALDGSRAALLTKEEFEALSVRTGNLTEHEREMINSHAQATFRILSQIPWTREMAAIPEIACSHHERVDGSGYPKGLRKDQIMIESRILAVIDIYEALVAQDRPYKPKMAPEKAIGILCEEAAKGHLDTEMVTFFIDQEIYRLFDRKTDAITADSKCSAY